MNRGQSIKKKTSNLRYYVHEAGKWFDKGRRMDVEGKEGTAKDGSKEGGERNGTGVLRKPRTASAAGETGPQRNTTGRLAGQR